MRTTRQLLLLIVAVAACAACGEAAQQVHSSGAFASANPTTSTVPATVGTTPPVTEPPPATTTSTTLAALPTGWRGPAEVDAVLALVGEPPATMPDCLSASPFSAENDDAAVLTCLDNQASRYAYGVTVFERSDAVAQLAGIPNGVELFQDCIGAALSSDLVIDRLVEIATTARYWGPDRHGDDVATEVIDNQFGTCWQRLALG